MFIFMNPIRIDSEERIREEARDCWVGEIDVDDDHCEDGEEGVVAKAVEADVGVERPDNSVRVPVKEGNVLLKDCLVPVTSVVGVCAYAVGCFHGSCFVCARGPWEMSVGLQGKKELKQSIT